MPLLLSHPTGRLHGRLRLDGSKSISNRWLILQALANEPMQLEGLSTSADTQALQWALRQVQAGASTLDVGHAGTSFRFLTALLTLLPGEQVLTGSARMKQRPIAPLVEALQQLGARIDYLEQEGYPPLRIGESPMNAQASVQLDASLSSQFSSALLLIAPQLPQGLELELVGTVVSRPYIDLSLELLRQTGIQAEWLDAQRIRVSPGVLRGGHYAVEADWSAASYYYAMGSLATELDLHLDGLQPDSLQGDAVLPELMEAFGVRTEFTDTGIRLLRHDKPLKPHFDYDFLRSPDLAQTLTVLCAARGVSALLTGLDTLRHKETDRIEALQTELAKLGSFLSPLPQRFSKRQQKQFYLLEGQAELPPELPSFATYQDHRMAMAFAMLALKGPVHIEDPEVVEKSYPRFWEHLEVLGFVLGGV
jgi:3-phosphoshikimate 1-carboxyvinyltransferase